jgi:60S ribosomal subunit assembly/export protein LOC1
MATKTKSGSSKGANKRSQKPSSSSSTSKSKKPSSKTPSVQHKPSPRTTLLKKSTRKPPHLRYTEKELKVPQLNGIRPSGVQKLPNKKKGKKFVDDGEGMKMIMAMVMAEKEGDVESKMMRARQLEEVREARKAEMEKRAESRKAGLDSRKEEIRASKKKGRRGGNLNMMNGANNDGEGGEMRPKKKVSFG